MDNNQSTYLAEATRKVKETSFYMKRAMDADDLKGALTHASDCTRELHTNLLSPKSYYSLYMQIVSSLQSLEDYFYTLAKNGKKVEELYEKVQSCGNVLPRLYLLITIGAVYIRTKQAPAKDVLNDLVEMVKGVQNPMRGLFLRHYLSQATRDKLPDIGTDYEGTGGTVQDAYEFILQNFAETNRLWVRMQNTSGTSDKKQREKERKDLRILVGTGLVRLSQLDGVGVEEYSENILPRILEQVENCKDKIAQSYLMDCIIQVFPDEFHLATLRQFLDACTKLKGKVNVRTILESMMNRLSNYSETNGGVIPEDVPAFEMFNNCVTTLIEEKKKLSIVELLRLHCSLLNFSVKSYPHEIDYVSHILTTCHTLLGKYDGELNRKGISQVEHLLSIPLVSLGLQVFDLSIYSELMEFLPWNNRKQVSLELLNAILTSNSKLTDSDKLDEFFTMLTPLIRDNTKENENGASQIDEDEIDNTLDANPEFIKQQQRIAKCIHLIYHDDTDQHLTMLVQARRHLSNGGTKRIKYTLVPLVFAALGLAQRTFKLENEEETLTYSTRKVFQFSHEIVSALSTAYPEIALKLFLQCSIAADSCGFSPITYEFVSQSLIVYEDELTDSRSQVRALMSLIGSLLNCSNLEEGDYDALITKTTQHSAKLLKKPDQCRMVVYCSHLFWRDNDTTEENDEDENDDDEETRQSSRDGKRVLECLQRALKIADVCVSSTSNVGLFVDILDRYLYYFENHTPYIVHKYISGLVALINEHIDNMDVSETRQQVEAHYRNILEHIRNKKTVDERFQPIDL